MIKDEHSPLRSHSMGMHIAQSMFYLDFHNESFPILRGAIPDTRASYQPHPIYNDETESNRLIVSYLPYLV